MEIENLGKQSGVIDESITNRIQEIEERISVTEDTIENIDTTVKENTKCKKAPNPKQSGNPGHNEETKPKDRRYRRELIVSIKGLANIFNKLREENTPNLKIEMPINIQESYRNPNRLNHKRKSSCHIKHQMNKEKIKRKKKERKRKKEKNI